MPLPTIALTSRVVVRGSLFGQDVEHVWACKNTASPPTEAELVSICGAFQATYLTIMAPLSDQYSINEVTATFLGAATGPEFTLVISPAQQGGVASPSSPGNVALCVSLRSGFTGRRNRGRKFFSGLPESAVADNAVDSTTANNVLSGVQDLIDNLALNNTPLAVVSYVGQYSTEITTATCVDLFVDSMRRRLSGRGR